MSIINDPNGQPESDAALAPVRCSTALIAIGDVLDNLECKERECREKAMKLLAAADAYHDAHIAVRCARNTIEKP